MISKTTVTIPRFGQAEFSPAAFDLVITRYLPASPDTLKDAIRDMTEDEPRMPAYLARIDSAFLLLCILADFAQSGIDHERGQS
jgi:hypothetical protein